MNEALREKSSSSGRLEDAGEGAEAEACPAKEVWAHVIGQGPCNFMRFQTPI